MKAHGFRSAIAGGLASILLATGGALAPVAPAWADDSPLATPPTDSQPIAGDDAPSVDTPASASLIGDEAPAPAPASADAQEDTDADLELLAADGSDDAGGAGIPEGADVPGDTGSRYAWWKADIFRLANEARATEGLQPLLPSARLNATAQAYAEKLAAGNGDLIHRNMAELGLDIGNVEAGWTFVGENLARGMENGVQAHIGWMGSPGHRANIMRTFFNRIGIGMAVSPTGTPFYVQHFGTAEREPATISHDLYPQPEVPNVDPLGGVTNRGSRTRGATKTIWLKGWAIDADDLSRGTDITVTVNGVRTPGTFTRIADAGKQALFDASSDAVGFTWESEFLPYGAYDVEITAINIGGGHDQVIYRDTTYIEAEETAHAPKGELTTFTVIPGSKPGTSRLHIEGWASDQDQPDKAPLVTVWIEDKKFVITPDIARPDVTGATGMDTDVIGFSWTSPDRENTTYGITVQVDDVGPRVERSLTEYLWNKRWPIHYIPPNPGLDPVGKVTGWTVDQNEEAGTGRITISGWAYDLDDLNAAPKIRIAVGGLGYTITPGEVATAAWGVSGMLTDRLGFTWTSPVLSTGKRIVTVTARNVGGGADVVLRQEEITIGNPPDPTKDPEVTPDPPFVEPTKDPEVTPDPPFVEPTKDPEVTPDPPIATPTFRTDRWAPTGTDTTALALARRTLRAGKPLLVASADNYADALSAAPAAAAIDADLVLSPSDGLSTDLWTLIRQQQPSQIFVIGGRAALSDYVHEQLLTVRADTERLSGADRYATSRAIAQRFFPEMSAAPVVLATGADFPDALSGAVLAATRRSPIILVDPGRPADQNASFLTSHGVTEAIVLGGFHGRAGTITAALDADGVRTSRISGRDRYETSALIARNVAGDSRIFLASGTDYQAGLAVAAEAARTASPILLTERTCLSSAGVDALAGRPYSERVAVGGTGMVSRAVLDSTLRCRSAA